MDKQVRHRLVRAWRRFFEAYEALWPIMEEHGLSQDFDRVLRAAKLDMAVTRSHAAYVKMLIEEEVVYPYEFLTLDELWEYHPINIRAELDARERLVATAV
jgi:hypothetical protein